MSGLRVGGAAVLVPGRQPLRVGPWSTVWAPRRLAVPVALAAVTIALALVSVVRGDLALPVSTVVEVLSGGGSRVERLVVVELRLPRALVGALIGLALGAAGALTQAMARNPLASPDVLGIEAGAGLAAVTVIVLGGGGTSAALGGGALSWVGLPLAALAGGLLTAVAVYVLAWRGGMVGVRLVLVGIGVGAMLISLTNLLLVRAQVIDAAAAMVWLTGSLNGRGWEHVGPVAVAVVLAGVLALATTRGLGAARLGDDTARALGLGLQRHRLVVAVAAVALASVATAAAGPVLFVGLVAPQIAARLLRTAATPVVTAALTGAVLVLGADLLARTALPVELPVGVVTAALGAPWLIVLLVQRSRRVDA